jgi:hypothetical protein
LRQLALKSQKITSKTVHDLESEAELKKAKLMEEIKQSDAS